MIDEKRANRLKNFTFNSVQILQKVQLAQECQKNHSSHYFTLIFARDRKTYNNILSLGDVGSARLQKHNRCRVFFHIWICERIATFRKNENSWKF